MRARRGFRVRLPEIPPVRLVACGQIPVAAEQGGKAYEQAYKIAEQGDISRVAGSERDFSFIGCLPGLWSSCLTPSQEAPLKA